MTGGIHQGFSFPKDSLYLGFPKPEGRLFVFTVTMSPSQEPVFPEYETETSQTAKLIRKFKETPFVPIGEFRNVFVQSMWEIPSLFTFFM